MLMPKAQYSLADAKRYFREHLSAGDYYTEGQHVSGHWFGKGAVDLGLSGVTNENEFVRLCENRRPQTGEQLTLRQNTARIEIDASGMEQLAGEVFGFRQPVPWRCWHRQEFYLARSAT
jgi:hypothetical protein